MPALVVDVEHLDRVVRELRVRPRAAELPVRAADDVHELLRSQPRLGVQGDEAALAERLKLTSVKSGLVVL